MLSLSTRTTDPPHQIAARSRLSRNHPLPVRVRVPEQVLAAVHPRAFGLGGNRELFRGDASPLLDPVGIARTGGALVLDFLLAPERLNRVATQGEAAEDGLTPGEIDSLRADGVTLESPRFTPLAGGFRVAGEVVPCSPG